MEDKTLDRNKRGIRYFFDLPEGTRITYRNQYVNPTKSHTVFICDTIMYVGPYLGPCVHTYVRGVTH